MRSSPCERRLARVADSRTERRVRSCRSDVRRLRSLEIMIIENVQREDLNATEEEQD